MTSIHWKELPGNKYLKKPEPFMLADDGYLVKQEIKPIGRGKTGEAIWYEVLYDKDYVVSKLVIDLMQSFRFKSLNQFFGLMVDVWEKWKSYEELNVETIGEIKKYREIFNESYKPMNINLSKIKPRKLHGKQAYYVDELIKELAIQGFVTEGISNEESE